MLVAEMLPADAQDVTARSGSARDVTGLLLAWRRGDAAALAVLMPLVYRQLRTIAGRLLVRERAGHTLETAALVNEAFLRLVDLERVDWECRAHFFAMCARIMRRVLVDHARYHGRAKRAGGLPRISLDELRDRPQEPDARLVELDEALRELARSDPEQARILEMQYFGGLRREQIAVVVGISSATVTRRVRAARAWLRDYLAERG